MSDAPASPVDQRKLSPLKRFAFAIVAVIAFFVVLELVLWGGSLVVYDRQVARHNPTTELKDGKFRIVTFGDSVTAGQGTAPRYSYPRQLESLLNEANPGDKFEVINNGVYALNSSRLGDLLPGWIEEFSPNLIVVMAGCNNAWNYRNSHLETMGLMDGSDRAGWQMLLDKTRTYRFLRVALKRQKEGFGIAEEQAPEPVLRDQMQISASVSPAVDGTARTLERQRTLLKDTEKLDALLKYDLDMISWTAGEAGIPVVLMTYPFKPPYQDHRGITRQYALDNGLIGVDNYAEFQRLKRLRPNIELFSADRGHPNATGYRVVAAEIYKALYAVKSDLGIELATPPDPLASFKDPEYLRELYEEVRESSLKPEADEYVFETLGHVAMEMDDFPAAEAAFLEAFARSNGAPQFYESLGNLYVRHQKWDELDGLKDKMLALRGDRNDIEFLIEMFEREAAAGRAGKRTRQVGGWGQGGDDKGGKGGKGPRRDDRGPPRDDRGPPQGN
ncbi:MAG: hypothetical protein GY898_30415 [Proteobacteria bacterium]|nr:hypothetical protein [Pseudomonadota bacterium]